MRIYSSCREMLSEVSRDVFSRGVWSYDHTRQGKQTLERAKELVGYAYRLTSFDDLDGMLDLAREMFNKDFFRKDIAEHWFNEMFDTHNPQTFWLMHPQLKEYYKKYCAEIKDIYESYTYGERLTVSYDKILDLLAENPERRAAVVPIFWIADTYKVGKFRVPCSMFYQFLIRRSLRGRELHLIYVQRSCDLAWFFPFDVYRAVRLLQHTANKLNARGVHVKEGHLIHFISSLHCFESDLLERYKW